MMALWLFCATALALILHWSLVILTIRYIRHQIGLGTPLYGALGCAVSVGMIFVTLGHLGTL